MPKASNFTSGGVQNRDTKNRRLGTIVMSIQDSKPREKQISKLFSYCELIDLLRNGTIVRCLWENKKTSEKSVFREAWSPELTSQSFPVSCFWCRGFVPHRKWNLMLLAHQNTVKENRYRKKFFATLISTLGRFNRANKKKSVKTQWHHIRSRLNSWLAKDAYAQLRTIFAIEIFIFILMLQTSNSLQTLAMKNS